MAVIRGITVELHNRIDTGAVDAFNAPVYKDKVTSVDNVLVTPVGTADITDTTNLEGKTESYQLCIPKGDENEWTGATVIIRGKRFKTVGTPKEYIEELVPLQWNKQIMVERYE